jgi:hypothetical protein
MRIWTLTPVQMWLLIGLFWLTTSVLALSIRAQVEDSQQTMNTIGAHSERNLTSAQDLYFVLSALDDDAARYLLVDAYPSSQLTRDRIRGDYQALRQTAVNLLVSVDQNVTYSERERYAVYRVQAKLHVFEAYVASAWLLCDLGHHADAVAAYEQATDTMQNEVDGVLEAALDLADINRQTLNAAFALSRTQAARAHLPVLGVGSGWTALASLAVLMLFLFRRTRRVFNPSLIVGAGLTLALMISGNQVLSVSGERMSMPFARLVRSFSTARPMRTDTWRIRHGAASTSRSSSSGRAGLPASSRVPPWGPTTRNWRSRSRRSRLVERQRSKVSWAPR